jgi:hypothetical protein
MINSIRENAKKRREKCQLQHNPQSEPKSCHVAWHPKEGTGMLHFHHLKFVFKMCFYFKFVFQICSFHLSLSWSIVIDWVDLKRVQQGETVEIALVGDRAIVDPLLQKFLNESNRSYDLAAIDVCERSVGMRC